MMGSMFSVLSSASKDEALRLLGEEKGEIARGDVRFMFLKCAIDDGSSECEVSYHSDDS